MTDNNKAYLCAIVDRSGSMQSIAGDMEGAIKHLLSDQAKEPGELHVDIVRFDSQIEVMYDDVRAEDVKHQIIEPRGATALNDAMGQTIARLGQKFAAQPEAERPGTVIIAVVTDGYENSSVEYTADQVKALVTKQETDFQWKFVFLGTGIDSFSVASGYGIAQGSTMNFAPSSVGTYAVADAMSGYASTLRTNTSRGVKKNVEFSEDDRDAAMQDE